MFVFNAWLEFNPRNSERSFDSEPNKRASVIIVGGTPQPISPNVHPVHIVPTARRSIGTSFVEFARAAVSLGIDEGAEDCLRIHWIIFFR